MASKWAPVDAVFMFISRNPADGQLEVWLEVTRPDEHAPMVFQSTDGECLPLEHQGIVDAMMMGFQEDVRHLLAQSAAHSPSVRKADKART